MSENKGSNQMEGLRENDFDYRLLVQNMKDYAICMLDPEGRIVSWTEGAERLNGYLAEEIIGKQTDVFYSREDIAEGKPRQKLEVAAKAGHCPDAGPPRHRVIGNHHAVVACEWSETSPGDPGSRARVAQRRGYASHGD